MLSFAIFIFGAEVAVAFIVRYMVFLRLLLGIWFFWSVVAKVVKNAFLTRHGIDNINSNRKLES